MLTKLCSKCITRKPVDDFYVQKYVNCSGLEKQSIDGTCKKCKIKMHIEWQTKNKERVIKNKKIWNINNSEKVKICKKTSSRKSYLKCKYKMSEEEYNKKIILQKCRCKICGVLNPKRFAIDHCHKTGKIRGLLCIKCNLGIGYFSDDIKMLKLAIKYLEEYK